MNIKNILLITPPQTHEERYGKGLSKIGADLPPMGLMYIAATLEKAGYEVKILDTQLKQLTIEQTVEECKKIKPDMIGIGSLTSNYNKTIDFCKKLKENLNTLTIIGGPHATIMPMQVLKNKCIDFVIRGEGEFSIVELVNAINSKTNLKDIAGIGFKENNIPVLTKIRPRIDDLDRIPFPARHLVNLDEYRPSPPHYKRLPTTTMFTSRGCPYDCTFCNSCNIWGRAYKQRSIQNIIKEIKYLIGRYGIKDIYFWDDLFGVNRKWLEEFCDTLIKEKIDITWHCEYRANLADQEILQKMAEAGCWAIFYGFESMDEDILKIVKKQIKPEQIRNTIRWTKKAGIEVRANFILGLPGSSPKKDKNTVKEITKLNPDYVKFNIFSPYPSTEAYNQIKEGQWGEMTEEFDKLTGYFPTFKPEGYKSLKEVKKMKKWAYWKYYLRPSFMIYKLSKIKSYDDLMRHIKGFKAILSL